MFTRKIQAHYKVEANPGKEEFKEYLDEMKQQADESLSGGVEPKEGFAHHNLKNVNLPDAVDAFMHYLIKNPAKIMAQRVVRHVENYKVPQDQIQDFMNNLWDLCLILRRKYVKKPTVEHNKKERS